MKNPKLKLIIKSILYLFIIGIIIGLLKYIAIHNAIVANNSYGVVKTIKSVNSEVSNPPWMNNQVTNFVITFQDGKKLSVSDEDYLKLTKEYPIKDLIGLEAQFTVEKVLLQNKQEFECLTKLQIKDVVVSEYPIIIGSPEKNIFINCQTFDKE